MRRLCVEREEDSDTKDAMIEEAVWVDDWWGCRHNRHAHTVVLVERRREDKGRIFV